MAKKRKSQKIRADFRKNRETRVRDGDLTRQFSQGDLDEADDAVAGERIRGKAELFRRRTVVGEQVDDDSGQAVRLEIDETQCLTGRVLRAGGLESAVQAEDSRVFRCATRRLLKTLSTDQRHVVATGDRVLFRPTESGEGIIERVEPRRGVLSRTSKGRQHVIVANVDLLLIVSSAAEPRIKPNLIDRLLVTAEYSGIKPVICINKTDLADPSDLQPLAGVYGQLGYEVLLVSAKTGFGIERFKRKLVNRESVMAGQSGVGKSSLLNAVVPSLNLRIRSVSAESEKGRHTTSAAELIPLPFGGYVVDTPGVRQFQLWDVIPEEVAGFYPDIRPYVPRCRYPDCTHTHEEDCAVKDAVADGRLDTRRYESYCQLFAGEMI
jgi:ribosome biogenesis GTPase